jgi:opacity protein-like surface antigen
MRRISILVAVLLLAPAVANAQARRPQPAPTPGTEISIRGFGDAGFTVFTAGQSFEAILGRPSGPLFGGGIEVRWARNLFASVSASRFRRTGHRAFVFEGQVFSLNVPTTITVTPIEFTAGYRFRPYRIGTTRNLVPYAGAGVGFHKYDETSPESAETDDVHTTHAGYQVLGGIETPLKTWLAVAGEAQWASVPNALGGAPTGVSNVFNEHNLGGFTFRVKVAVGQ